MINEKKLKIGLLLGLIIIMGLIFEPVAGAPVVTRDVSVSGDTATITFSVGDEEPFAVGIVETVPEEWSFSADDSEVSSSKDFEVDRENNKIAFFLSNEDSATYYVTGTGDGRTGFTSEWVDLLYLTPDMDEGKERWETIGADSGSGSTGSAGDNAADGPGDQKSPGFGIFAALAAIGATGAIVVSGKRRV